jgi:AcrR family transcriptional regulator
MGSVAKRTAEKSITGGGRERLLAAAVRRFAVKGYAGTTVRDILRDAGVSAPVLYYHFGNKEGLFLAIAHEGMAKIQAARKQALQDGGSAAERILRLVRAHAAVRHEYADLAWVVDAILSGPSEAAPNFDFRAAAASSVQNFERLVREGIATGEFRACTPRHAALAVMGAIEITSRPRIFDPPAGDAGDQLEGMLGVILAGLRAPRG